MRKVIILMAYLCLFSGCAKPTEHFTLYTFTYAWTDEDIADCWDDFTIDMKEILKEPTYEIKRIDHPNAKLIEDKTEYFFLALQHPKGFILVEDIPLKDRSVAGVGALGLSPAISAYVDSMVFAHEYGHRLGLPHLSYALDPCNFMNDEPSFICEFTDGWHWNDSQLRTMKVMRFLGIYPDESEIIECDLK